MNKGIILKYLGLIIMVFGPIYFVFLREINSILAITSFVAGFIILFFGWKIEKS